MTVSRDRKEAAKHLGIALQVRYRRLLEATGDNDIAAAAVDLGNTFNNNIEFVCWVLKEYGGVRQMPFERRNGVQPAPKTTIN